jgi:hypothetical protein
MLRADFQAAYAAAVMDMDLPPIPHNAHLAPPPAEEAEEARCETKVVFDAQLDSPDACSICMDYTSNVRLPCGHTQFCMDCISKWEEQTCPLCRHPIDEIRTSDPSHKPVTDREELRAIIRHLARRHSSSRTKQYKFVRAATKITNTYPARELIDTYNMIAGMIEMSVATHTLDELMCIHNARQYTQELFRLHPSSFKSPP